MHYINLSDFFTSPLRKTAALLAFVLLSAFSSAQNAKHITTEKPKVRKEIRKNFDLDNQNRALEKQVETEFDIHGKIVQFTEFDVLPEGRTSLNRQTINKYNNDGRRIGTMVYDFNNVLLWSEELQLDNQGRTVKASQTDHNRTPKQSQTSAFEYDSQGNEVLSRSYNHLGDMTSEKRRSYNSSGEMVLQQYWYYTTSAEQKLMKRNVRTENEFNSRGHLIKSVSDIQEGKNKWQEVRYFENCAIVECDKYENGKLISHYRRQERDTTPNNPAYDVVPVPFQPFPMEYDSQERDLLAGVPYTEYRTITLKTDKNGNIIKKIIREYGQVFSVTYYTYDQENYLTKELTILKADDSSEEYRYEYDKYYNLVKETKYINNKAVKELAVIYEYYHN
jgi:hypothetical protein